MLSHCPVLLRHFVVSRVFRRFVEFVKGRLESIKGQELVFINTQRGEGIGFSGGEKPVCLGQMKRLKVSLLRCLMVLNSKPKTHHAFPIYCLFKSHNKTRVYLLQEHTPGTLGP